MSPPELAERLQRPLVGVIAMVFAVGASGVVLIDPDTGPPATIRAGLGVSVDRGVDAPDAPDADGGDATVPSVGGSDPVGVSPADPGALALGVSAVPAAGTYRYEVETTADGRSTVQEELREVVVLEGDRTAGVVEVSARLAGESQVSVIDWSPGGAMVRSTRIESDAGAGRDCSWDPPFPELGALGIGATWTLRSTCRTPVGGIDTSFTISGTGRVVGEAQASFGDEMVRVWQIERDRTTDIRASLGDQTLTQQAREQGTLFFDPVRGIVIRSDVTVTLTGSQSGVTRRVSALVGELTAG